MPLVINWKNQNAQSTTVKVYRGDTPLNPANLPESIGSVNSPSESFLDSTALAGNTYYYIFETISATDRVLTTNQKIQVADRRGAGPNLFQFGDMNYGYYGTITSSDFFTTSQLIAAANNGMVSSMTVIKDTPITWFKFSRNGQTLYVPEKPLGSSAGFSTLFSAGLIFGVTSKPTGVVVPSIPWVNQNRTITLNGDTYLIRCMKGYSDDLTLVVPNNTFVDEKHTLLNEYNDLVYPIVQNVTPLNQRMPTVPEAITIDTAFVVSGYSSVICQEMADINTAAMRGVAGYATRQKISAHTGGAWNTGAFAWMPVLELIPSVII